MINGGGWAIEWVSINGGTPIAELFLRDNPYLKWMMIGGTPILGNPPIRWVPSI